ncbi:MAG: TlpA family protein disulfide reductase, partial [bacterium]|nr:TlpA family protein disulfide reductase [bacterium]
EDILVVALAQDDRSSADVRAYLKKRNLANLRVFHDREGTLAAVLGIDGVPTSYVLDPQGRMIGVVKGRASWDTPEAQAFLRYLKRASAKTSSE